MHSTDELLECLSAEERLLLRTIPPEGTAPIGTLGQLRWPLLHAIAADERAAMAVWQHLQRYGNLPAGPSAPFRQLAMVTEFKQHQLQGLMERTITALVRTDLTPMLLKGAAVSALGCDDFLERPMADLDLLLPAQDARRAWDTVQQHGWVWNRTEFPLDLYEGLHHLPPLLDAAGSGQRLEIHHELFARGHPFVFGADMLRARAGRVDLGSGTAAVPSLEDVLLHVCLHFSWSHVMESKAWRTFRDVYVISTSGRLDWERFVERAHEAKAATGVYWTLRLAVGLGIAVVPNAILTRLQPPRSTGLLRRLERHFVQNMFVATQRCPSHRIRHRCWELGMCPRRSGHGAARPWRTSITLPSTERERRGAPSLGPHGRVRRAWQAARYLIDLSLDTRPSQRL